MPAGNPLGYLDMLTIGSDEEQLRAAKMRQMMEEFDAEQKREEQERLSRLFRLTQGDQVDYNPPVPGPGQRMTGATPRVDSRLALAERNINSLTGGGLSPAEQDASRARVQSRTGPGGVMAPRGVNPHSLTPGPQISTAIPGAAPEGPRFDPNDPSQLAARMNNGVGGLHILRPLPESRVVDREGLAERRAASQAEREQELAAREAHRMQFYKNRQQSQAQAAAQNAFLQRIMQLPPGVASAVIEGQTRTGIAGMENDRLREMGDTKSREQGAALYIALIEAGMSPDAALARVQQFGFSPGGGAGPGGAVAGGASTPVIRTPTPEQAAMRAERAASLGVDDVIQVVQQIGPEATPDQILDLIGSPGKLAEAIQAYEGRTAIFDMSPADEAAKNAVLAKLHDLYRRVTGREAGGVTAVNPRSRISEVFEGLEGFGILGM